MYHGAGQFFRLFRARFGHGIAQRTAARHRPSSRAASGVRFSDGRPRPARCCSSCHGHYSRRRMPRLPRGMSNRRWPSRHWWGAGRPRRRGARTARFVAGSIRRRCRGRSAGADRSPEGSGPGRAWGGHRRPGANRTAVQSGGARSGGIAQRQGSRYPRGGGPGLGPNRADAAVVAGAGGTGEATGQARADLRPLCAGAARSQGRGARRGPGRCPERPRRGGARFGRLCIG